MLYYNNLLDIETIKDFDIKFEDFISSDKSNDTFEEIFTKIFSGEKIIELNEENELDYYLQEKPNLSCNSNIFGGNKSSTSDKSEVKQIDDKEDSFSKLYSVFEQNKSNLFSQNSSKVKSCNDIDKESKNLSISMHTLEGIIIESDSFLDKKRNIFRIDYPNDFLIFHCGISNQKQRKIIDVIFDEFSKNDLQINDKESIINSQKKKKYCKKIQNIRKRKENADNIRKKIKSRFFKILKNTVNEKLKKANLKIFFKNLPQAFISNVSKDKNKSIFNLTFKELYSKNFCEEDLKESDLSNYYHNISIINYLEQNNEISKKTNYLNFKNIKIYQIYKEYLKSKEFEVEITSLKKEKESDKYIKNYIIKAGNLFEFFSN